MKNVPSIKTNKKQLLFMKTVTVQLLYEGNNVACLGTMKKR